MKTKSIIRLAMAFVFAMLGAQITKAQGVINGQNVTMVMYQDPGTGGDVQINMDPNDNSKWYEHSPNGPFTFKVGGRDEWSVYLWDADRNMAMQIDLHTKKITYGSGSPSGQVTGAIGTYPIKHSQ